MHNFLDPFNSVERFRRGKYGVLDETEDPTFLTFSVDFETIDTSTDGSYFGFPNSPLLQEGNQYSAIEYLKNIGIGARADRLKEFTRLLIDITHNKPWYIQSIAGLNKLWAASTNMGQTFKGKDLVLEFETLEAIDLKMNYLADLYRKAVYDPMFMREMVPENLRKFEMNIYIAEFRSFHNLVENFVLNKVNDKFGDKTKNIASKALGLMKDASGYFEKNVSFMQFNCHLCEFDFSETFAGGDKLNVHTPEMALNKFKVNVDWFREVHSYTYHDIMTKEYWTDDGDLNEFQWKKKQRLTLNGVVGAVSSAFQAGQNIASGAKDVVGAGKSIIGGFR